MLFQHMKTCNCSSSGTCSGSSTCGSRPTVFVGAESRWAGVRELYETGGGPQGGFRQDVCHIVGIEVT